MTAPQPITIQHAPSIPALYRAFAELPAWRYSCYIRCDVKTRLEIAEIARREADWVIVSA